MIRVPVLLFLIASISGCAAVAPFVQTYNEIGVSSGDRQALLDGAVKDFNSALYWGNMSQAVALSTEQGQPSLKQEMRRRKKEERVVESQVELVDFDESSHNADVEVLVKFYKVPFYVVNERIERQKWTFELGSGWKFVSLETVEEG